MNSDAPRVKQLHDAIRLGLEMLIAEDGPYPGAACWSNLDGMTTSAQRRAVRDNEQVHLYLDREDWPAPLVVTVDTLGRVFVPIVRKRKP